jgi:hypothetical protein
MEKPLISVSGFFLGSDPSCQRLTPFHERKGKSNDIGHQENSERLHVGFEAGGVGARRKMLLTEHEFFSTVQTAINAFNLNTFGQLL